MIEGCTGCGACREVCAAESLGGHTITSLLSGGDEYSTWLCSCCWLCQEVCPEGVDIHAVMIGQRRGQPAPETYRRSMESVRRSGFAFPIGEEVASVRAAFGLPPLEPVSGERLAVLLGSLRCPDADEGVPGPGTASCAER